ncbi:hypothetical protein [Mycoplana rhizolycopersici]|uniref:hypothetical protein n=1 Tax=Mycoplana rhizolycopersici TaxID=2746702 RepID=UPI0031B58D5E
MRRLCFIFGIALLLSSIGGRAGACTMLARLDLDDVQYADVVVVGRVSGYHIVLDPIARERFKSLVAKHPGLWKSTKEPSGFLTDYARFKIMVDEVLRGNAPHELSVTWDNSTFGEPESIPSGPFLVALRDPSAPIPPLRGPSATGVPNLEPGTLTVLQAPCSRAFLFEVDSQEAQLLRQQLARPQQQ